MEIIIEIYFMAILREKHKDISYIWSIWSGYYPSYDSSEKNETQRRTFFLIMQTGNSRAKLEPSLSDLKTFAI